MVELIHPQQSECAEQSAAALRHKVYFDFLAKLSLSNEHRQKLRQSGHADDAITQADYKTADPFAVKQALGDLKQKYDDNTILLAPEFTSEDGRVSFGFPNELLLPVRDAAGQISSLPVVGDSTKAAGTDEVDDWVPTDVAATVAPFPVDVFPEPLQKFATEAAAALQCPVDFLGVSMLAVAGSALGNCHTLQVREGYEEGSRIFAAIVAQPGQAKSPALSAVCRPVYDEQNRLCDQFQTQKLDYQNALQDNEAGGKAQVKEGDPLPLIKPIMHHLYVQDVTTEALATLLDQNPRGLLMCHDELTSWMGRLNQYRGGRGADRQFYQSCWGGEPAKVDRKSKLDEPLIIFKPFLCVVGCIPPAKLPDLDAGNDGEDGFVHRILFSFPAPIRNRRWNPTGLSADTQNLWNKAVARLYMLMLARTQTGRPLPMALDFTADAKKLWADWYNAHMQETEAAKFPDALVGPWSKFVAYAARLALVIHFLGYACGGELKHVVEAECLQKSIKLLDYFKSHARAVYVRLRSSPQTQRAQQAIQWVRRNGGACNTTRLAKNNVASITRKSEAIALMKQMEDCGYGRCEMRKTPNRREVLWFVAKRV